MSHAKGIIQSKKWFNDFIKFILPRNSLAHGTRNNETESLGCCEDEMEPPPSSVALSAARFFLACQVDAIDSDGIYSGLGLA
jgi:hypothetical protein